MLPEPFWNKRCIHQKNNGMPACKIQRAGNAAIAERINFFRFIHIRIDKLCKSSYNERIQIKGGVQIGTHSK